VSGGSSGGGADQLKSTVAESASGAGSGSGSGSGILPPSSSSSLHDLDAAAAVIAAERELKLMQGRVKAAHTAAPTAAPRPASGDADAGVSVADGLDGDSAVAPVATKKPKRKLTPKGVAGKPTHAIPLLEVFLFLFVAASNFYFETFAVYSCISCLSPIPYAICDVVRRLTMIMFSVFVFQVWVRGWSQSIYIHICHCMFATPRGILSHHAYYFETSRVFIRKPPYYNAVFVWIRIFARPEPHHVGECDRCRHLARRRSALQCGHHARRRRGRCRCIVCLIGRLVVVGHARRRQHQRRRQVNAQTRAAIRSLSSHGIQILRVHCPSIRTFYVLLLHAIFAARIIFRNSFLFSLWFLQRRLHIHTCSNTQLLINILNVFGNVAIASEQQKTWA
jgi:hypothetical protein